MYFVQEAELQRIKIGFSTSHPLSRLKTLRSRLNQTKEQVLEAIEALLTVVELSFEAEDAVEQALLDYQEGNADFGECLHLALARKVHALPFYTFDKKASKALEAKAL